MTTMPKCEECMFFEPDTENPKSSGHCRRYPPTIGSDFTEWPFVHREHWCGEGRRKPDIEAAKKRLFGGLTSTQINVEEFDRAFGLDGG